MLIGEVAKQSGLTRDSIRYYEKAGLLPAPYRRDNRYKEYPDDTVQRLTSIKTLQSLGFALGSIRELLELADAGATTCGDVGPTVQRKVRELDGQIAALTRMRSKLDSLFLCCKGARPDAGCAPVESLFRSP